MTREEYDREQRKLDEAEFTADMSDDFYVWKMEMDAIAAKRAILRKQALDEGLIADDEDINRTWRSRK